MTAVTQAFPRGAIKLEQWHSAQATRRRPIQLPPVWTLVFGIVGRGKIEGDAQSVCQLGPDFLRSCGFWPWWSGAVEESDIAGRVAKFCQPLGGIFRTRRAPDDSPQQNEPARRVAIPLCFDRQKRAGESMNGGHGLVLRFDQIHISLASTMSHDYDERDGRASMRRDRFLCSAACAYLSVFAP